MIHAMDGADVVVVPALAVVCSKCGGSVAVVATESGGLADAKAAVMAHIAAHGGQAFTNGAQSHEG